VPVGVILWLGRPRRPGLNVARGGGPGNPTPGKSWRRIDASPWASRTFPALRVGRMSRASDASTGVNSRPHTRIPAATTGVPPIGHRGCL